MSGHDLNEVATSLERLASTGVLTRIQSPTRPAQLFVFSGGSTNGGALSALLELAATRAGRVALTQALASDGRGGRASLSIVGPSRMVVGE